MRIWAVVADGLARRGTAVVVTIRSSAGSTPREAGTRMVVFADGSFTGTIGGGTLEWRAIAEAQRVLSRPPQHEGDQDAVLLVTSFHDRTYALGPELGQCCGGRVTLRFETIARGDLKAVEQLARLETKGEAAIALREDNGFLIRSIMSDPAEDYEAIGEYHRPLYLFGAGHVGRALTLALAPFTFYVTWIDPRPDAFPAAAPRNVRMVAPADPVAQLAHTPADAFILIMTHSHELDLALCDAALRRDFPYVGVIGSATKRARFETRLQQAGIPDNAIAALVCPIGAGGPKSKLPAAIAAATLVELLVADEQFARQTADVTRSDEMDSDVRRGLPVAGERGRVGGNKR